MACARHGGLPTRRRGHVALRSLRVQSSSKGLSFQANARAARTFFIVLYCAYHTLGIRFAGGSCARARLGPPSRAPSCPFAPSPWAHATPAANLAAVARGTGIGRARSARFACASCWSSGPRTRALYNAATAPRLPTGSRGGASVAGRSPREAGASAPKVKHSRSLAARRSHARAGSSRRALTLVQVVGGALAATLRAAAALLLGGLRARAFGSALSISTRRTGERESLRGACAAQQRTCASRCERIHWEQKAWPHDSATGASCTSRHMPHRSRASSSRSSGQPARGRRQRRRRVRATEMTAKTREGSAPAGRQRTRARAFSAPWLASRWRRAMAAHTHPPRRSPRARRQTRRRPSRRPSGGSRKARRARRAASPPPAPCASAQARARARPRAPARCVARLRAAACRRRGGNSDSAVVARASRAPLRRCASHTGAPRRGGHVSGARGALQGPTVRARVEGVRRRHRRRRGLRRRRARVRPARSGGARDGGVRAELRRGRASRDAHRLDRHGRDGLLDGDAPD